MFKPANPNSRIPAILQAHTRENAIAQLSLAAVFVVVMVIKDRAAERRFKEYEANLIANPPMDA